MRRYLNHVVEQDHRAIKQRCASMLGLKSFRSAAITFAGIELAHRIRKGQHSLPLERQRTQCSLKEMWDCALSLANGPVDEESSHFPSMHQISPTTQRETLGDALTGRLGPVRYPRKVTLGRSLYLLVTPKGTRFWRYCYQHGGKRKTLSLGMYPDVSVARAKSRHQAARSLLAAGVDPSLKRHELRNDG
jgi:hypothetical protein